jgi:hypothetical protein
MLAREDKSSHILLCRIGGACLKGNARRVEVAILLDYFDGIAFGDVVLPEDEYFFARCQSTFHNDAPGIGGTERDAAARGDRLPTV